FVSPQVQELLGYDHDLWADTPGFWASVTHPEDLPAVLAESERTNETGEHYRQDYRMLAADGRTLWVHDEAHLVRDAEDRPLVWQGVIVDITERKEAEERYRHAQERLQALIDHMPAVVYTETPDDPAAFYISPQIEAVFGYSPQRWRETEGFWRDHIHDDDRDRVMGANDRSNETKEPFAQEYRFRRADGSYAWIHDSARYVLGEGREDWWQGFMLDVTERKEAEQQLAQAEEMFRTIVEHNPAVIYTQEYDVADPGVSRTTYISPRQPEMLGYSVEEVMNDGTLWTRILHPEDRDRVLAADLASNVGAGDRFSMTYRMIHKDGRIVWVQDDANLVRIEGRPPFWQGFMMDITERKQAEQQLERALEVEREATGRLRALDEMKNTFLQAVSHDLRTPLAAILGLAITLERGDVHLPEDDARDLAHRIAGNARRLDRLVTNLLDLDRLSRGIVTPKLEPVDVGALVQRVVRESDLVTDARVRTDLPELTIPVDAAKVERVVENLLANAVRHTPPTATIWVSVRAEGTGVLLAVEDDGPGVPAELRESIFEPFQQGANAPAHSPGVGVGLTLVRRFAELHRGQAWVEDREGGGASFRVFLPGAANAPGDRPAGR
ncbi:MAG TPA: PAS domain-containing protein, partial [Actinomycetota bacterium]